MSGRRRHALSRLVGVGVLLVVGLASLAGYGLWQLEAPGPHIEDLRLEVRRGDTLRAVLERLHAQGALRQPRVVEVWARLTAPELTIRRGRYLIPGGLSARDVLAQLASGRVELESITFIEGSRFADLRRTLASHPEIEDTLSGVTDAEVMRRLGDLGTAPEGRFFPDTYRFAAGTRDIELLTLAHARMASRLAAAWAARDSNLPLRSADEALVLASIVEKETALASERARIAGVFIERLRRGMRLQSDPTVIYGLGDRYDGNIRRRDLTTDTPFNTYTRQGLPPTPIALPGEAALRAVVRPEVTGELFFVATGDPDGSHVFSRTYAEHRRAVAEFIARRRAMLAREASPAAAVQLPAASESYPSDRVTSGEPVGAGGAP